MKCTFLVQLDEVRPASADGKWPATRNLALVETGREACVWSPVLRLTPEDVAASPGLKASLRGASIEVLVDRINPGDKGRVAIKGTILALDGKPLSKLPATA